MGMLQSESGKYGEDGGFIDEIHERYDGDFESLERHHGFIQWLFPVFENSGVNWRAYPLTRTGAAQIRCDRALSLRVLRSYRIMLRFFGLRLADEQTGRVERLDEGWRERLENLNSRPHNFKRISRMLTSLGELGFRRYKAPFLAALQREIDEGHLPRAAKAYESFWWPLVHSEGSAWYVDKTSEEAGDLAEGCLFEEAVAAPSGAAMCREAAAPPPEWAQPPGPTRRLSRRMSNVAEAVATEVSDWLRERTSATSDMSREGTMV